MANKGTSERNPFVPYNASYSGAPTVPVSTQVTVNPETGDISNPATKYETSLPMALNIEAALTYSLGCITGLLFLCIETKNDYVRFHAWQSTLVFTFAMVLHLFFIFSSFFSWLLFFVDLGAIGFLG
eukprot:Sdes_comp20810_c0_seq1m17169